MTRDDPLQRPPPARFGSTILAVATPAAIHDGAGADPGGNRPCEGGFGIALGILGRKLLAASTPAEAGFVVAEVSRQLIGWDAFFLLLPDPVTGDLQSIVTLDTFDGEVRECFEDLTGEAVSPVFQEVFAGGPRMILRGETTGPETIRFCGNKSRRSESLLFVPIRQKEMVVGVLSVQSYTPRAYSADDLETLDALASHCGGTLHRLQAQKELVRAERTFQQAFEASPVAMSIAEYTEGRALDVNPAFLRLFGYSREEVVGRTGTDLALWDEPSQRAALLCEVREGRPVHDRELRLRAKGGEEKRVLITVEAVEVEGEKRLLFYNYDITDRVRLEEQLRQVQKLDSIGRLAAGVAHDFNNMLAVIEGCTSWVLAQQGLDEHSRVLLKQVSAAAQRSADLTRQLLAFSCRQSMQRLPVDAGKMIEDLAVMLRRLLGPQVQLEVEKAEMLPEVRADPGMLEQVLVNLAVNARDAMESRGRLTIAVAPVRVAQKTPGKPPEALPGRYLRIRFKDTGCGIRKEDMARIFEPFFTTKTEGRGSGLGLATAYGIMKQHEGWIEVESRAGEGAAFSLFLPAAPASEPAQVAEDEPEPLPRAGGETVLVVEDEEPLRELVREILSCFGYRALTASCAAEALELWARHHEEIDGVVTDIVMPGALDGREMAEILLRERPNLPVLFISGYSQQLAGVTSMLGPGRGFLPKPFEAAALVRTLRGVLDQAGDSGR